MLQIHTSCLSPHQIVSSKEGFFIALFSKLCLLFSEQGWNTTLSADRDEASYKLFIANGDVKNQMKEFNIDERVDFLFVSCLSRHVELREVVKLVMILQHGNTRVESGFSANEETLVENMSEDSLKTRRSDFDRVTNEEDISNVDVNKKMLKFVNNAHSKYVKQLEK